MKRGCAYCKQESNGDFADNHKSIFCKKMESDYLKSPNVQIDIDGKMMVVTAYCPNDILFTVVSGKIKYCPMCGRKLEREVEHE